MTESDRERFGRLRDEYDQAMASMSTASFSATSEDGYVTVGVDAQGHVVDLEFDPRVRRLHTYELKDALLSTITQARVEADRNREEAMQAVFGPAYQRSILEGGSIAEIQAMAREVGQHLYNQRSEREGDS